jgi:hypothetical protein
MPANLSPDSIKELTEGVRKRFVESLVAALPALIEAVEKQLLGLMNQVGTSREMQNHRDAWMDWQQHRKDWSEGLTQALGTALNPAPKSTPKPDVDIMNLELVGDDMVENKLIAARMAQALTETLGPDFTELRSRLQELLQGTDSSGGDVLKLDTFTLLLVEQWVRSGLKRETLQEISDDVRRQIAPQLKTAYQGANEWLLVRGVVPNEDLRSRVRRSPSAGAGGATGFSTLGPPGPEAPGADSGGAGQGAQRSGMNGSGGASMHGGLGGGSYAMPTQSAGYAGSVGVGVNSGGSGQAVGGSPALRSRLIAQGLVGQLQRLLGRSNGQLVVGQGASAVQINSRAASLNTMPASEALAQALASAHVPMLQRSQPSGGVNVVLVDGGPQGVAQASGQVREASVELKKKTDNPAEKATIEIVALMFQSILSEERLPTSIRVWFARLQVPVLRVALAEPEFFENLSHPARLLIDRMGSCVLGFDSSAIAGSALEIEIRRVVQVIEQYPETGRRVFQLVHDEFQKFLDRFLTEKSKTSKLVSVAQQVEQKEALAIQYTIELRNMLKDMPVRDEIRDFLFKVWSEVLALSAVRSGPQHADTVALKKAASDLVWAASAKPNRSDRARVIHDLPMLLQRLRQGLSTLGINGSPQEAHIKILSETLADAFLSKTEAIPQATIDAMAKRLAHLEDYVTEEGLDELPLDAESLEVMLGVESSYLTVVVGGGAKPSEEMLAWALDLQPGHWFTLDHNGTNKQVQYAWRSDRRQLHLFAAMDGASYLIQLRRLAAYLQAGLLVPQEDETLTLRATRNALAKLEANPERLLN